MCCVFWLELLMCCILFALILTGSVDDIIDHYKKEQIVEGYNLKEPVSVQVGANIYSHYITCSKGHFWPRRMIYDNLRLISPLCLCDKLICLCIYLSSRNRFLLTQWMGEKSITLSDGKQKMLSTKTLSRKATSCSTKVYWTSVLRGVFNKDFQWLLVIWKISCRPCLLVKKVRIYN